MRDTRTLCILSSQVQWSAQGTPRWVRIHALDSNEDGVTRITLRMRREAAVQLRDALSSYLAAKP